MKRPVLLVLVCLPTHLASPHAGDAGASEVMSL